MCLFVYFLLQVQGAYRYWTYGCRAHFASWRYPQSKLGSNRAFASRNRHQWFCTANSILRWVYFGCSRHARSWSALSMLSHLLAQPHRIPSRVGYLCWHSHQHGTYWTASWTNQLLSTTCWGQLLPLARYSRDVDSPKASSAQIQRESIHWFYLLQRSSQRLARCHRFDMYDCPGFQTRWIASRARWISPRHLF